MPGAKRGCDSVLSMAQSNAIAGPRAVVRAPSAAANGAKGSSNTPKACTNPGQINLLKSSSSNTSVQRYPATSQPSITSNPAQLIPGLAGLNINSTTCPQGQTYDPSNGPSPSTLTVATNASRPFSVAPSYRTARSQGQRGRPVKTKLCTLTTRTRQSFGRGDILAVPVHKTNRDPTADLSDKLLTQTMLGGVYSKRRMVVVLWKTQDSMFCLPLHSYSRTGLSKKPNGMKNEFVCVKNEADKKFHNQGLHPPVEANCKHPLDVNTVIPLGDHVEVGYRDDIAQIGEMTGDGFVRLLALWDQVVLEAKSEPRRQQIRGRGFGQMHSNMPAIVE